MRCCVSGTGDASHRRVGPLIELRPTTVQVDDLLGEICDCAAKQQRVLVTTFNKRIAEDLMDYLAEG